MSCDVFCSPMFYRVLWFPLFLVCLIVALFMYITRGQVALYRARLDLLSTRTSQYTYISSIAQSPCRSSVFYTSYTIYPALVAIVTLLAIATGLVPSQVLQYYPCLTQIYILSLPLFDKALASCDIHITSDHVSCITLSLLYQTYCNYVSKVDMEPLYLNILFKQHYLVWIQS